MRPTACMFGKGYHRKAQFVPGGPVHRGSTGGYLLVWLHIAQSSTLWRNSYVVRIGRNL